MGATGPSKARPTRMGEVLAGYVARGDVPGLVAVVSRRGDTHVEAHGTAAFAGAALMRADTIFGLRLDDPVDDLPPEPADLCATC